MAAAWKRTGVFGLNGVEPADNTKQNPGGPKGYSINDTGVADTLENHKAKPGNFSFNALNDLYYRNVNIIENGTFADATVTDTRSGALVGWSNGGTGVSNGVHGSTAYFTISSGRLNIVNGGGAISEGYIYQQVLAPAGVYTYSVYVHDGTPLPSIRLFDSEFSFITGINLTADDGTTQTGTLTVSSDAVYFAIANLLTTGTAVIDTISLIPDTSMVPDGTFEDVQISKWFRDDGNTTT